MKKKHMIMIFLSLLLLMQPLILADSNQVESNIGNNLDDNITTNYVPIKQDIGVGGEEQIKTNYNLNYGFEEIEPDGGPLDYSYYGDAYRTANTSYTGLTHTGTYACRLASYGTEQFGAETKI